MLNCWSSLLSLAMKQNVSQLLYWVKIEKLCVKKKKKKNNRNKRSKQKVTMCSVRQEQTSDLSTHPSSVRDITTNMEKCASPRNRAQCTRTRVITLMCFDSSESLNIKLYWIWNENSWGTRLDQHFRPSPLDDTYSTHNGIHAFRMAFIFHTPTHALTFNNPHALWPHLCKCTTAYQALSTVK